MKNRALIAAMLAFAAILSARTAAGQKADSTAKADSATRADSIALVRELEKELGGASADSTAVIQPEQAGVAAPRASGGYMNIGFVSLTDAGWSTASDVQALEPGDHDPHVKGFTIPNAELSLDGAVDPYFKGAANIVLKIDPEGETGIELEEVYALTTSLPANLQLKFGQFFAEFGRQNPQHPHSWAFVDQPLVLNKMFGPEGLRSQGVRLSWLLPTSFYSEALLGVFNSNGGTTSSFRSPESPEIHGGVLDERPVNDLQDMLIVPRFATSFDISETQTVVVGASAAFGPNNSGPSARSKVYGVDGYWKWKPAAAEAGFPFLSMQAEALVRTYDAAKRVAEDGSMGVLPAETLKDRGAYAQLLWGIKPRVVAGIRGDWSTGDDGAFTSALRGDRFRVTPNVTWYPTEFSKFRIQYNYDDRKTIGTDHSIWFQFEFLLGAHASHKF
ncbi:MAG: hypothetical protein H0W69_06385 [Gemmatimonadaceae bacterium]|nr:hypothetical protein [Gemmatimonadaceae bacterium]